MSHVYLAEIQVNLQTIIINVQSITFLLFSSRTGVVRECLKRNVVIGQINSPVQVQSRCDPSDISDSTHSRVFACTCDTSLCNGRVTLPGEEKNQPQFSRQVALASSQNELQETPRRGSDSSKSRGRTLKQVC